VDLLDKIIPAIEFSGTTEKAFEALQKAAGVKIAVLWSTHVHEPGFTRGIPVYARFVRLSVREILDALVDEFQPEVDWVYEKGGVRMYAASRGAPKLRRTYDIGPLVRRADWATRQGDLAKLVRSALVYHLWPDDSPKVVLSDGQLHVTGQVRSQKFVQELLEELRNPSGPKMPSHAGSRSRQAYRAGAELLAKKCPDLAIREQRLHQALFCISRAADVSIVESNSVVTTYFLGAGLLLSLGIEDAPVGQAVQAVLESANLLRRGATCEPHGRVLFVSLPHEHRRVRRTRVYRIGDILRWPKLRDQKEVRKGMADEELVESLLSDMMLPGGLERRAPCPQAERVLCAVEQVAQGMSEHRVMAPLPFIVGEYLILRDSWRIRQAIEGLLATWRSHMAPTTTTRKGK
jgi:hypothetical protein